VTVYKYATEIRISQRGIEIARHPRQLGARVSVSKIFKARGPGYLQAKRGCLVGVPSKSLTGKLPEGKSLVCEDLETAPLCANPCCKIRRFLYFCCMLMRTTLPRFVCEVAPAEDLFIKRTTRASRMEGRAVCRSIPPV